MGHVVFLGIMEIQAGFFSCCWLLLVECAWKSLIASGLRNLIVALHEGAPVSVGWLFELMFGMVVRGNCGLSGVWNFGLALQEELPWLETMEFQCAKGRGPQFLLVGLIAGLIRLN